MDTSRFIKLLLYIDKLIDDMVDPDVWPKPVFQLVQFYFKMFSSCAPLAQCEKPEGELYP